MRRAKIVGFLKEYGMTLGVALALLIAWLILRTPGDTFASTAELEAELRSGQPTVVEFYSNRCSICLLAKPKVDELAAALSGQARVLRLDVADPVGRTLAARWGVVGTPTFFVLDGAGQIVYAQAGAPDVSAIRASIDQIIQ